MAVAVHVVAFARALIGSLATACEGLLCRVRARKCQFSLVGGGRATRGLVRTGDHRNKGERGAAVEHEC